MCEFGGIKAWACAIYMHLHTYTSNHCCTSINLMFIIDLFPYHIHWILWMGVLGALHNLCRFLSKCVSAKPGTYMCNSNKLPKLDSINLPTLWIDEIWMSLCFILTLHDFRFLENLGFWRWSDVCLKRRHIRLACIMLELFFKTKHYTCIKAWLDSMYMRVEEDGAYAFSLIGFEFTTLWASLFHSHH